MSALDRSLQRQTKEKQSKFARGTKLPQIKPQEFSLLVSRKGIVQASHS